MVESIILAVGCFLGFLLLSFAVLIVFKRGKVIMKVAEFVIILTGSFGIVKSVYDVGVRIETNKTNFYKERTQAYSDWIEPFLSERVYNIHLVRTEHSPENFDDILKDSYVRHQWVVEHKEEILNSCRDLKKINWDSLDYPICYSGEHIFLEDDSMRRAIIEEYNAHLDTLMANNSSLQMYAQERDDVEREISLWLIFSAALFTAKWILEFADLIKDTCVIVWLRRKLRFLRLFPKSYKTKKS